MIHPANILPVTQYAPAERLSDDLIVEQINQISSRVPAHLFNLLPYIILILNKERQVIFSNDALMHALGLETIHEICGLRPGEVFKCLHAAKTPGGCGTTEYCSVCGAVQAILECQQTKAPVSKECRLTRKNDQGYYSSLDLTVSASPLKGFHDDYTIFIIKDVSEEKRKQIYEKVFLHDIINTSGAIKGFLEMLAGADNSEEATELCLYAHEGINTLIEEIQFHKELIAAENGELVLTITEFSPLALIQRIAGFFSKEETCTCEISIKMPDKGIAVSSDLVLVKRVLMNMLKNGVEASRHGDVVSVGCDQREGWIEFWVHNPQGMTRKTQLQIFQRSFSTKGVGRGIGTYSMKLLGETYLGGEVDFTSDRHHGTRFYLRLPMKK